MHDDGPSPEDIERFSGDETAFCPHCGAEIWDEAPQCSACDAWLHEGPSRHHPVEASLQKRVMIVLVAIVSLAFLWGILRVLF
ncbi:MAG: zinc ribbon domain-containing protein [Phycisphaerales bacterium]|nr:zinc ribbon domain-containing protein [Phycisphaerales bacterium]